MACNSIGTFVSGVYIRDAVNGFIVGYDGRDFVFEDIIEVNDFVNHVFSEKGCKANG